LKYIWNRSSTKVCKVWEIIFFVLLFFYLLFVCWLAITKEFKWCKWIYFSFSLCFSLYFRLNRIWW